MVNPDDLSRNVYCILGLPIEAIEMAEALQRLEAAAANKTPFLISTVNVNFLTTSQVDPEFRRSILISDLCPPDGMPIVWIARILGVPIKRRVAGSDIFDALKSENAIAPPLKILLFGAPEGVAAAAGAALNEGPGRLRCVASIYPGFGSVEALSQDTILDEINASQADMLVVSLGAAKGQAWLLRNHDRLRVPVRTHLGAVINFAAATVKRAPLILRKLGLEWLWRIKEEPHLWRRYWQDGRLLTRLLYTRILPLAGMAKWQRMSRQSQPLAIKQAQQDTCVILQLSGFAIERHVVYATSAFRSAMPANKQVVIDLSETIFLDCRFFGLLLMLRKSLEEMGKRLKFIGISPKLARLFRLNGVEFLLLEDYDT